NRKLFDAVSGAPRANGSTSSPSIGASSPLLAGDAVPLRPPDGAENVCGDPDHRLGGLARRAALAVRGWRSGC
ncbi:MAG TPA: hypothetical protein VF223_13600, partial [Trebonia sp.]